MTQNTLILCISWTASTYTFFFCEFYIRFVPDSTIYSQKVFVGFVDLLSTVLVYHMAKHLDIITLFTWLYGLLIVSSLSLVIA